MDPDMEAASMASAMQSMGTGAGFAAALAPATRTYTLTDILRAAGSQARVNAGEKVKRVMGAPRRRPGPTKVLLPGRVAQAPQVAVLLDVSGSMSRAWVANAVKTTLEVMGQLNIGVTFVTHTCDVEFAGKVKPGEADKLAKAAEHSGSTRFAPAYAAVVKLAPPGGYDCAVHFTDCDGEAFPARLPFPLVVGGFGHTERPAIVPTYAKFYAMEDKR